MTTEQKLATIVEAQRKGGCDKYDWVIGAALLPDGELIREHGRENHVRRQGHVLHVLLDPDGLRAAYGKTVVTLCNGTYARTRNERGPRFMTSEGVAHRCLDAWLFGEAEAAIQTAYDILSAFQR